MTIRFFKRCPGKKLSGAKIAFIMMTCSIALTYPAFAAWMTEIVDATGDVGKYPAMAFDSNNVPHISYYDDSPNAKDLKYAHKTNSWNVLVVDSYGDAGYSSDLGIDSAAEPQIAYLERSTRQLRIATHDATGWHHEALYDQFPGELSGVSLEFNLIGYPHMSLASSDATSFHVYHYFFVGAARYIEEIEMGSLPCAGIQTRIEIDDTYFYHIVYSLRDINGGTLRYAYGQNMAPPIVVEDITPLLGGSGGFGLDLLNQVHPEVSYHNANNHNMNFAIRSGTWVPDAFDTTDSTEVSNSIRIDTLGNAHIAYYTGPSGVLKYAFHDASGWHVSVVDNIAGCGAFPAMALDVSNQPRIAYYDTVQGNLKYAWLETKSCQNTGVKVSMPETVYQAGDMCYCKATVCNAEPQNLAGYPLFVILDVFNSYYCAPSFTAYDNYLSRYPEFSIGGTVVEVIPEFVWPSGLEPMSGLIWYAALTDPGVTEVFGDISSFTFGWE